MAHYIDGFVIPIPTARIRDYKRIARLAAKIWKEHGALDYYECVGDDLDIQWGRPFPALTNIGPDETVLFSWIVFKSRKHRDAVNAKVRADPRLDKMMADQDPPFDCQRMTYGGFQTIVRA